MQVQLKVMHPNTSVRQVKLLPCTVIGRSTECNLRVASSHVSRIHCRIIVREDTVLVEDLGSANGTLVDDQLLEPHQPLAVQPGAKVSIGPAEFLVDFVAPTSKTAVIPRSASGVKTDQPVAPSAAESGDRDFIIVSNPENTEYFEGIDEETALIAEKMASLALPEVVAVTSKPMVAVPTSLPFAKVISAVPVGEPMPVVKTPVARVVTPPTAQTVVPARPEQRAEAPSELPFQFVEAKLPKGKLLNDLQNIPNKLSANAVPNNPSLPETVSFLAPVGSAEVPETVTTVNEVPDFDFKEPTGSVPQANKPTAKGEKGGGKKSLFSMFGRKPNATGSKSTHTEPVSESFGSTVNPRFEATADSSPFDFIDSQSEPIPNPPVEPENDDFQKFLRQL